MPEPNNTTQKLNSYYTTDTKVEKSKRIVVSAPDKLPVQHVFNYRDADSKWKSLNADIWQSAKKEKKNTEGRVIDYIIGTGAVILSIIGIRYIIKFFRKS